MDKELQVALDAAQAASEAILEVYERDDFEVQQKSGGRGPLTEADLASNEVLIDAIRTAFPDDGLLSEESADDPSRLGRRRVWIIDPLDGTREFTLRRPQFVVSVGLAVDGAPALGVLLNPVTGEVFTGVVGQGATYDGQPCTVTGHAGLDGARLLVSDSEHRKGWFADIEDRVHLEPVGSVAYKLGLVAAGKAEATFTPKPRNEWDLLGGAACLVAAGGRATNGEGHDYAFNRAHPLHIGVAGTNGALHGPILELVHQLGAP